MNEADDVVSSDSLIGVGSRDTPDIDVVCNSVGDGVQAPYSVHPVPIAPAYTSTITSRTGHFPESER